MGAHLCGGVVGEHKVLGDHEIEGPSAVDLDVQFPGVVLAGLFEDIEGGLQTNWLITQTNYSCSRHTPGDPNRWNPECS